MTEVIRGHRTQSGALSGRSSLIARCRRQSSAIKRNQAQSGALSGLRLAAPQSKLNPVAIKSQSSSNQVAIKRNQAHLGREPRLIVHLVHLGDAPDEGGNQMHSDTIRGPHPRPPW